MFYTQLILTVPVPLMPIAVQASPSLAGVWTVVSITPPPKEGAVAALPPSDLTITQTTETVSLSTTTPWGDVSTTVYSLDGREDRNLSGAVTRLTRSKWAGTALVTEGRASQVTSAGYDAWTLKETMRLDGRGQLIIDRQSWSETHPPFQSIVTYRKKGGV